MKELKNIRVLALFLILWMGLGSHWVLALSDSQPQQSIAAHGSIAYQLSPRTGIQTNGTDFTLNGENVRLTGVHMTLWQDSGSRYKGAYFDLLENRSINAICLDFGWNFLEPQQGNYSQEYLGKMDWFINETKARGVYVILRMGKWSYPSAYQAVDPSNQWVLGFPAWLGNTPNFWENYSNCWGSFVATWTMLSDRYTNEPYVAGFDLITEPGNDIGPGIYDPVGVPWLTWDCNTCRKVMGVLFDIDKLYERTVNAIHSVSNKFVILEPFSCASYGYVKPGETQIAFPGKPNSQNFAVGESIYPYYDFAWLNGDLKAVSSLWNVPCVTTEFGVQVASIPSPAPESITWVENACQEFASRGMSWFYWGFGPGPDGDYNLVRESDDAVSPILSTTLANCTFGLLSASL